MLTDEEGSIEAMGEALELAEYALHSRLELGFVVEIGGTDVAHVAVGIRYYHLFGAPVHRALHCRIDVTGHDPPAGFVGRHSPEALLDLLDPGDAFPCLQR